MKRPLILVTNDDGISAPGIRNLIRIMNDFGDVVVVAPDGPQSGMGHAITIDATLRCDKVGIWLYFLNLLFNFEFTIPPAIINPIIIIQIIIYCFIYVQN